MGQLEKSVLFCFPTRYVKSLMKTLRLHIIVIEPGTPERGCITGTQVPFT